MNDTEQLHRHDPGDRGPWELPGATLDHPRRRTYGYLIAFGGVAVVTGALLPLRDSTEILTVGIAYLVVVISAAAVGGLGPGVVASVLGFVGFNYVFLPPYGTYTIHEPEHVLLLFALLAVSLVISHQLATTRDRAEAAEARRAELDALRELSAELVVHQPGPETYRIAVAQVIARFGFDAGALFTQDAHARGQLDEMLVVGAPRGSLSPTWDPRSSAPHPERLSLSVGGRNLGLLILSGDRGSLSAAESRVLRTFCDQLALLLERDRLLQSASEAEIFRQTEETRRALVAAVSHDLRSPLAAIKASVTDLLDESVARPDARSLDSLRAIDSETDRLTEMIANLLDWSRIEQGMLKPRMQSVDVQEIATAAVDRARRSWPTVGFAAAIDPDASLVAADPIFLDRVLANLLDNAAREADAADERLVEVTTRRASDRTEIRIIDHGRGLSEEGKRQLFQPMFPLDRDNPRLGRGLGLAITKGFVDLMFGALRVDETPGGGTTMSISLRSRAAVPEAHL